MQAENRPNTPKAEMDPGDPYFKQLAFALLREKFERELPPWPEGKELDQIIAEEGGMPLETFIDELKQLENEP